MIAATIVATISTIALLSLSGDAAQAGTQAANRGLDHAVGPVRLSGPVVATRGDIDLNADNVIDLSGVDIQAVSTLQLLLSGDLFGDIDLTPPYTADGTGTDPDFSTSQTATVVTVTTEDFSASSAAWTVTFPGTDDGDNILEHGEKAEMTVWLYTKDMANGWFDLGSGSSDPFVDSSSESPVARDRITVRITSDDAPETSVTFVMPIELTSSMLLQ